VRCVNNALKKSRINIKSVDYINAHATSTSLGDAAELQALKRLFSNNNRVLKLKYMGSFISSTKGITGHTLSMSGALEVSICALFLKYRFISGSANITKLDKLGMGLKIIRKSVKLNSNIILNNSSGFGGANVCIILKKYGY
jgi:3-oxoacyl-[acyl-carrier-protein] synthase I